MQQEAAQYASQTPEAFEIWPENQLIAEVFLALETEWRLLVGPGGVYYQGLRRSAMKDTIELMGIERGEWPDLFYGLRIMEATAQKILNEKDSW